MEDGLWDSLPVPFIGAVAEDFDGEEGELSLTEGTLVVVVQCDDDGWFTLHTKAGTGIFPGSYVDPMETIDLPITAKVIKNFPELGLKIGQTVTVQDISSDGWMVEAGNDIGYTSWAHLQIEPEVLAKNDNSNPDVDLEIPDFMEDRTPNNNRAAGSLFAVNPIRADAAVVEPKPLQGNNARPPQQQQPPAGQQPKGQVQAQGGQPQRAGGLSASQGGPGQQIHKPPQKQAGPNQGPPQGQGQGQGQRPQQGGPQGGNQPPGGARPQQPGGPQGGPGANNNPRMTMPPGQPAQQIQKQANPNPALHKPNQSLPSKDVPVNNKPPGVKPTNARVQMAKQAAAGTQTIAKREKRGAKPGEMHESQFATYRRPTSVFADVIKQNKVIDEKLNIYSIRQVNKGPRYEQEGRFEFRATSDCPPPPAFRGGEKLYATGQPSFVDWEAKNRSAVFDI